MFSLQESKWYIFSALIGLGAICFYYAPPLWKRGLDDDPDLLVGFSDCDFQVLSEAEKFQASYRQCLLEQLQKNETEIWNKLPGAVSSCLARDNFWKGWGVRPIGKTNRWYNMKYVSLPRPIDSSCVVVVIRQHETFFEEDSAEKKLLERMPGCKFHLLGDKFDGEVRPQPKFYNKRLAYVSLYDDDLWIAASEDKEGHFTIKPANVKMMPFLEQHVHQHRVDYLWIDEVWDMKREKLGMRSIPPLACFHEYSVFKTPSNVTVCQIAVINRLFIKNDLQIECRAVFKDLIMSVLSTSQFLPLRSRFIDKSLYQMYVNMAHPYCLKKFLASKMCDQEELSGLADFV